MRLRGAALALAAVLASGCAVWQSTKREFGPRPIVQQTVFASPAESLGRVGVMPFYPDPGLRHRMAEGGVSAADAAELVSSFVAEALTSAGMAVIPPNDLLLAFTGRPVPRLDQRAAADMAASKFGATSVLLGRVHRYRERGGEAFGTSSPASVAFEVTLFSAPTGRRLWTARFDETQQALGANVLNAPRYPGGGTRWLSAAELARWGAGAAARALATAQ
jgi:hypothetical protein